MIQNQEAPEDATDVYGRSRQSNGGVRIEISGSKLSARLMRATTWRPLALGVKSEDLLRMFE